MGDATPLYASGRSLLFGALIAVLAAGVVTPDVRADGRSRTMVAYSDGTTPKYRFWNGAAWESEQTAPDVGKQPEWVVTADCPKRNETALLTLDGDKDVNFTVYDGSSWRAVSELNIDTDVFTERTIYLAYEQLSGDLLITYWSRGDDKVGYRTWNGSTLSGESLLTLTSNKKLHFLTLTSKLDSDRIMLIAHNDNKEIMAAEWSGTAWGTVTELESNSGYTIEEPFSFAYEGLSGDGLIVYGENNQNEPRYRTWNGAAWSAEANAPTVSKKQRYIKIAADSASDEIVMGALKDDKDLSVVVWNGSSWGAQLEIEATMQERDARYFDLAYEAGDAGEALVVYAENNVDTPRYRTWNGTAWSAEQSGPDLGDKSIVIQLRTGSVPGEIFVACIDNGNDLHVMRWDGTSMSASTELTANLGGDKLNEPFMIARAPIANVLEVVTDPTTPTSEEIARRDRFRNWGYQVNLIDEADSQGNFDTAVANNHVAYVPEEIASTTLGTKLLAAPIGVVVEEAYCYDAFGLTASDAGGETETDISVLNYAHYITKPFATGDLTITTSSQPMNKVTQYISNGGQVLADWPGGGHSLIVLEAWSRLVDSTRAAGRRVFLPVGGGAFAWSSLNADGLTLVKRSLEWGRGLMAHWKLDDGAGTTASDEFGNLDATLISMVPASDWIEGRTLGALDFDGVNDRATTTAKFIPPLEGSLVFWMRVPGPPGTHGRILGSDNMWEARHVTTGTTDGIAYGLVFDIGANGGPEFVTTSTLDKWNHWYHVVATYSQLAGTYSIYLDGVLHKSGAKTFSMPDPGTFSLGTRTGSTEYFVGMLDDVRILNHVVEADEVWALRHTGVPRVMTWQEVQRD